ncbi:hypothetical protein AB6E05_01225 [Vibrio alginolyticus]|uniref:hypothetical protein n=1 Tax=Vibrio alginolyticus TaxID=663 RepID=UPI00111051A4|nr:hypothetical protein [Vibrio alginolyticus]EME9800773.1 hypothetical protein [Vibrio alginolyticus]MCS0216608.1 hypothetical protein [Vibrio alginolyticus]TMX50639.1 hypothetical protein DA091_15995 [Vibrio alginolyticus]
METFYVLKPQQDLNTIFITQDEDTAKQVFDNSTIPLQIVGMPITNPDTQDLVELYENEWLDLHLKEFKYPCEKNGNTYTYETLSSEEFLGVLVVYPNMLNKMVTVDSYRGCKEITEELEQELYEFFLEEL